MPEKQKKKKKKKKQQILLIFNGHMFKNISKSARMLSTCAEKIGNIPGNKSLLKIRQGKFSNETLWISCMESVGKDSLLHDFQSTAYLTKFT